MERKRKNHEDFHADFDGFGPHGLPAPARKPGSGCGDAGRVAVSNQPKSLGQIAFEAYNGAGANKGLTYDGKPVPAWPDLSEDVRAKWEAAAAAVRRPAKDAFRVAISVDTTDLERATQMAGQLENHLAGAQNIVRSFGIPFPPPPPPPDAQNPNDA